MEITDTKSLSPVKFVALVLLFLAFVESTSLAATIVPIDRFKQFNEPSIRLSRNAINYYGLTITETKEDIFVSYKGKRIEDITAFKLFRKGLYLHDAYIVDDYPRQGMRTLFVPTFSGGANCCVVDLIVTKTESGLVVSTVDSGSGRGISPDDIENDADIVVSSVCARGTNLENVDDAAGGWCTGNAPRPATCLVFDNEAWRFAKPKEKPTLYENLLHDAVAESLNQRDKLNPTDPFERQVQYANATTVLFYAIMGGKSDAETSAFLHQVLPDLDEQRRMNFIADVKATITDCDAVSSKTLRPESPGASQAPSGKSPASNAGGRFRQTPCGAIADGTNKLEWVVGPDATMTFDQAKAWVKSLETCGKGWELPTIAQLATLFDPHATAGTGYFVAGKHWPAHIDPLFSGIGGGSWVWSRDEISGSAAKSYNFKQGTETRTDKQNKAMTIRVFAVRRIATPQ